MRHLTFSVLLESFLRHFLDPVIVALFEELVQPGRQYTEFEFFIDVLGSFAISVVRTPDYCEHMLVGVVEWLLDHEDEAIQQNMLFLRADGTHVTP
jgi:hypothetical protein